jgi:hypothetical protein
MPKMFSLNLLAMNWPHETCSAVSAAQAGMMAFKMWAPKWLNMRLEVVDGL